MPNLVNKLTIEEFSQQAKSMGSCIVVSFDKMTVAQASELRRQLKGEDVEFKVCKNRLAVRALAAAGHDVGKLRGKCGIAFAPEEKAITAAKLIRDFLKQNKEMSAEVLAGVIEGEVLTGDDAAGISEMADRNTIRAQIAMVISAPARSLATALNGLGAGLARCLQQRADGESSS